MKRIILGVALGALTLSGPTADAACSALACATGSMATLRDLCDEGNQDCHRLCLVSDSDPIVCAP